MTKKDFLYSLSKIDEMFPHAHCELVHKNWFELLVAVMLSAQTTDESVNRVTPLLFEKFPDPKAMAEADLLDLESAIKRIGLYKNKAKNLKMMSTQLLANFGGVVPRTQKELESLAGVGRKTANVVLSVAFDVPRIAVDTHVERVSKRLGISLWKDTPLKVEERLMKWVPEDRWSRTHHQLIFFGRYFCTAKNPNCRQCPLNSLCREGKKRMRHNL